MKRTGHGDDSEHTLNFILSDGVLKKTRMEGMNFIFPYRLRKK